MSISNDSKKFKKELKLFLLAVLVFPVIALMLMFVVPMWYLEFKYPDFEDDYTNKIINTDTSNLSASPNLLSNTGISPFR